MTAYERILDALTDYGSKVVTNGGGKATAQCPAHDDRNPSLSVTSIEGSVLLHCFAGCDYTDVLAALGLTAADLYDDRNGATYRYNGGRVVHRSADPKKFWQSGDKSDRSLYRVERIGDAKVVFACEGEKDVWRSSRPVGWRCARDGRVERAPGRLVAAAGKTVFIVADRDEAGDGYAPTRSRQLLDGVATSVSVVRAAVGKDAADHLAAGHSLAEFRPAGQPATPPPADRRELLDDVEAFLGPVRRLPERARTASRTRCGSPTPGSWTPGSPPRASRSCPPNPAPASPAPSRSPSRSCRGRCTRSTPRPPTCSARCPTRPGRRPSSTTRSTPCSGRRPRTTRTSAACSTPGTATAPSPAGASSAGKIVETEELPAYCAVALAGLDDLPDTIMTRSVIVRMRRRAPGEQVEPWRRRVNGAEAETAARATRRVGRILRRTALR